MVETISLVTKDELDKLCTQPVVHNATSKKTISLLFSDIYSRSVCSLSGLYEVYSHT